MEVRPIGRSVESLRCSHHCKHDLLGWIR